MIDLNSKSCLGDRINWHIDQAIDTHAADEPRRKYLGCSVLGGECERSVQYEALSVLYGAEISPGFAPRIRRIFARGHDAEDRIVTWMRQAGFVLINEDPANGGQFEVRFCDGRIRGHADGLLLHWMGEGISPVTMPALWECKCLGAKYWRKAVNDGIRHSHSHYYAQMQLYMGGLGLERGLITCLNADTCELHHQLIQFDKDTFHSLINRANRILLACSAGEMLPRCATTEASFVCRMCRYAALCWARS